MQGSDMTHANNLRINLRQLTALTVLAEVRNFTKAAQILHVTQAGLSAMIKELESQLGTRLFERSPRHVAPTLAGKEFIGHAQHAINHINTGLATIQAIRKRQQGGLRIGVSPIVAATIMPAVVDRFTRMHPYACDIVDDEPEELQRLLVSGSLDAAYGMDGSWQKGLDQEYMFSPKMVFICHEGLLAGQPDPHLSRDWERFMHETLLALPQHHRIQRIVDNFMMEHGLTTDERKELRHIATIMSFVDMGRGIAFVPSFVAACDLRSETRMVAIPDAPIALRYYRVTRSGEPIPEGIHAFSQLLKEAAAELEA
jgi:DNA-binding transcriptional LysR family regulator